MGRIEQVFSRWRRSARRYEPSEPWLEDDQAHLRAALIETAHERDVSIARASEADERERLARERLKSLASLEHRVEVAERRALDAERRLEEISDRVNAAQEDSPQPAEDIEPPAGPASELRARLARAAARKRPRSG